MQGSYEQSEAERRVAVGALNTRVLHYAELNQANGSICTRIQNIILQPFGILSD